MSGFDNVLINVRERPASSDINNLQSLVARDVLDMLRRMMSQPTYGAFGGSMSSTIRNVVLGGLEVLPDGNDVSISSGALLQDSAALTPVPGAYDSTYRVGISRTTTSLSMPSPVGESWLVIEARMLQSVAVSESRDILDPSTGQFVPTMVNKVLVYELEFQATAEQATTIPAYTGGDWIPIAIVRRPGGGGAVATTDIYDVRPLWGNRAPGSFEYVPTLSSALGGSRICKMWTAATNGTASNNIRIEYAEAISRRGERLWIQSSLNIDPTSAPILQNGLVLAADTWYYLYLAPWRSGGIRNAPPATYQGNALLILSSVGAATTGYNGSNITPGNPFASSAIAAGDAVCIGAIRRNFDNSGWVGTYTADGSLFKITGDPIGSNPVGINPGYYGNLTPPVSGANTITPPAGYVPNQARSILLRMSYFGNAGAPAGRLITFRRVGAGNGTSLDGYRRVDDGGGNTEVDFDIIEIPLQAIGSVGAFDVIFGGSADAGSALSLELVGWRQ